MAEVNLSENDISSSDEFTDSFNIIGSVKNLYIGRQSLTLTNNKK